MAKAEHLKILREGVGVWNEWRRKHPRARPDLSGAVLKHLDLSGVDLHGANLRQAELQRASLAGANLRLASLEGAVLHFASLGEADLTGAMLQAASLRSACLDRTKLNHANLYDTDFYGCYLGHTDFSHAWLATARFSDVDLSTCRGLTKLGPLVCPRVTTSVLERTAEGLARHPENLAEVRAFFRTAGIAQWVIDGFAERVAFHARSDSCSIARAPSLDPR